MLVVTELRGAAGPRLGVMIPAIPKGARTTFPSACSDVSVDSPELDAQSETRLLPNSDRGILQIELKRLNTSNETTVVQRSRFQKDSHE